jgi:hypothetical protein
MSKDRSFDTGKSRDMERMQEAARRKQDEIGAGKTTQHVHRAAGSGGNPEARTEQTQ